VEIVALRVALRVAVWSLPGSAGCTPSSPAVPPTGEARRRVMTTGQDLGLDTARPKDVGRPAVAGRPDGVVTAGSGV